MFERFTQRARDVVHGAIEHARRLDHPLVGTEHLLLALLDDEEALAGRVLREAGARPADLRDRIHQVVAQGQELGEADAAALREIGIDLDAVRAKVEESFGAGALGTPVEPPRWRGALWWRRVGGPFSPRARKVLELSLREAIRLKHRHIGTEHILLGMLREGEGLAAQVLTEAGVGLDDLRDRVHAALRAVA